jgi:hypothetical protein
MIGLLGSVLAVLASPFKSKSRPEVGNAVFRLQLIVSGRRRHGRIRLTNHDRLFPAILKALKMLRPRNVLAASQHAK